MTVERRMDDGEGLQSGGGSGGRMIGVGSGGGWKSNARSLPLLLEEEGVDAGDWERVRMERSLMGRREEDASEDEEAEEASTLLDTGIDANVEAESKGKVEVEATGWVNTEGADSARSSLGFSSSRWGADKSSSKSSPIERNASNSSLGEGRVELEETESASLKGVDEVEDMGDERAEVDG